MTSTKTLFVRNLPYSTSDSQLEEIFSRHGPLKACFTVKEKDTVDKCRGFGYVTYENREDAEKAKSLTKMIGSRPVQIVFAKQREPKKKTKGKKNDTKMKDNASDTDGKDDDTITGNKVDSVTINSDGGGARNIDSDTSDGEGSVKSGDQSDSDEDYESITARNSAISDGRGSARGKNKRKTERGDARFDTGRVVVVGNLPEGAVEKELRKECEQIGKVESLVYPVPEREIPSAYVTYSTHKEARLAVSQLNGQNFGDANKGVELMARLLSREGKGVSKKSLKKSRLIVRNLSFKCSEEDVKGVFEKHGQLLEVHIPRKPNGHMLGYAFVQYGSYFAAKKAVEAINMMKIKGRPVAVDWVVPKDQYEQSVWQEEAEGRGRGKAEEDEAETKDVESNCESDAESHDSDMESHDNNIKSHESDAESYGSDVESRDSAEEEADADALKRDDVTEGKTLFIRNLPLNVDHKELKQLFYKFGRVRYCRVMFNAETGLCTGSAFIQFKDVSSAQSCVDECSSEEHGISYGGQRLEVTFALSRGEVEKVHKERGAEGRRTRGEDKRNLYLAKEGVILPGSEAAADLSKTDMARRMKVYSQKKSKLVNPYFFVSNTRLSVHNLPINVTEHKLKSVFQAAAGGSDDARITQVKILRSSERVNSKGIGRSLGYGFVEFSNHDAALAALRATNNNPAIFGEKRRLIVEFAIEDSRALKLRERRKQRQMKPTCSGINGQAKAAGVDGNEGEVEPEKHLSKRQRWRLKCRAKRLRRRERKKNLVSGSAAKEEEQMIMKRTKSESAAMAVSIKLPTDKEQQLHSIPASAVPHNRTQTRKLVLAAGEEVGSKKDEHSCLKLFRKRKRKRAESNKEEVEFAKMVDKYRRKLQRTAA